MCKVVVVKVSLKDRLNITMCLLKYAMRAEWTLFCMIDNFHKFHYYTMNSSGHHHLKCICYTCVLSGYRHAY